MIYALRLTKGQDLKNEIEALIKKHDIKAGVILSSVGCLTDLVVRISDGKTVVKRTGHFEILSLNGTLSSDGVHLHISVSGKEDGNDEEIVYGGHLQAGCIVYLTTELIIQELDDFAFNREFDETTGYKELIIKKK